MFSYKILKYYKGVSSVQMVIALIIHTSAHKLMCACTNQNTQIRNQQWLLLSLFVLPQEFRYALCTLLTTISIRSLGANAQVGVSIQSTAYVLLSPQQRKNAHFNKYSSLLSAPCSLSKVSKDKLKLVLLIQITLFKYICNYNSQNNFSVNTTAYNNTT